MRTTKILVCGMGEIEFGALCKMCEKEKFDEPVIVFEGHKDLLVKDLLKFQPDVENKKATKERMILFNDMPQQEIIRFIETYKKYGFPKPLFCVVTEHNVEWSIEYLLSHLVKEREEVERYHRMRQKR
ncbi:DUF3783 domain-containing protein [Deferribacter autotrophicus]|uniref:DUF3783 domain-containing protein n=1 Tax=Deferribacter autotrophicus TaxID=500465 RepID=A0A5A8F802_9BACT|nr:DUF3783 domain-containing protein [Deferribacter autotrophicus]KAA0258148.1 DUF3783 domain-containing protein [Deferribacter autotrophicus]